MPQRSQRRKFLKGIGTAGLIGIAGCTGGPGDQETDTPTPTEDEGGMDDTPTATETDTGMDGYDFGGETLNVMVNVGAYFELFKSVLHPRMEEKYNLKVQAQSGVTTAQTTKVLANPENPPDLVNMDVPGFEALQREGLLIPLDDRTDILTNYGDIYDRFKRFENTTVSWSTGEIAPVLNTQFWDEMPTTWDEVFKGTEKAAINPWAWTGGPYTLLMAAAVATGESFGSNQLDIDAGFNYLEENLKPSVSTTIGSVSQATQLVAGGSVDAVIPFWDYLVPDLLLNQDNDVEMARRLEPAAIPYAEAMGIPTNSDMKEAALVYMNEVLSVDFQEEMSDFLAQGVTNQAATTSDRAKQIGAPTADDFDAYTWYDATFINTNRDAWGDRWQQIFGG